MNYDDEAIGMHDQNLSDEFYDFFDSFDIILDKKFNGFD